MFDDYFLWWKCKVADVVLVIDAGIDCVVFFGEMIGRSNHMR